MEESYERWKIIPKRNNRKPDSVDACEDLKDRLSKAETFDQFRGIFEDAGLGSDAKQLAFVALSGLAESAGNFKQNYYVYKNARFKLFWFGRMIEQANSFDEKMTIYDEAEPFSLEENNALQDMLEIADTFEQWKRIFYSINFVSNEFDYATFSKDYRQYVLQKMSNRAKTRRQLKIVLKNSPLGSAMRNNALRKLSELTNLLISKK